MVVIHRMLILGAIGIVVAGPAAARPALDRRWVPKAAAAPARSAAAAVADSARRIDVNRVNMFVWNSGQFGWNPSTFSGGLYFPRGTDRTALFAGGLWLGAQVGGALRMALAEYSSEYGPGPMVGGVADDPARPEHRVYKVARWTGNPADSAHVTRGATELGADPTRDPLAHHSWSEYLAGAAPHGAPTRLYRLPATGTPDPADSVDVPGPDVAGDQMLWCVYNDADPANHTNQAGATAPLGVEIQQSLFAFDGDENLRSTVFLRFRIINKGASALDSVAVSLWSDPDLGSFEDDVVGCEPSRNLGFCYNADDDDLVYGARPPAVGIALLRGPVDTATGDTLGLTAFSQYVGGNDPTSALQSHRRQRGLLPDGGAVVDPTTGQPTPYFHPGDPVRGTGWLDSLPANRLMLVSAGPFRMAPGDTQEVLAAIVVGTGPERLASVGVVRCGLDRARDLYRQGFDPARLPPALPCSTSMAYTVTNCPRTPSFWAAECAFGGAWLTRAQLDQVAVGIDAASTLFDWAPGGEGAAFCSIVDPIGPLDLRLEAKREYAVLMANYVAGLQGQRTTGDEPIWLNRLTHVTCPEPPIPTTRSAQDAAALRTRTIGQLTQPARLLPELVDATYANEVTLHRRALDGVAVGLPAFGGGAGPAAAFLGSALDPVADASRFATTEFRFDRGSIQKAYRYLRLERQSDGTAPPQGRGYLYAGFVTVPLSSWRVGPDVQIDLAFVERVLTDDAGTILSPAAQPATFDSTWAPDASASGGHEHLFALDSPYQPTPNPAYTQDGILADGTAPALFALASRLRDVSDVIDDGDRFRFSWGMIANPSADSMLVGLEPQPLGDPAVQSAYQDVLNCLGTINVGLGIGVVCAGSASQAILVAGIESDSTRVIVTWLTVTLPLSAVVERRSEGGAWTPLGARSAGPDGLLVFEDASVTPGGLYDYRLAVDLGGRVEYFGQVQVSVPGRSRFAFFGARPNPVTQNLVLSFSLATRAPARLELLDVAGRRVMRRDLVGLGAGPQVLDLGSSGEFRAGVYWIRITQEGRRITGKAVIVH